jgi:hypothetical protein
LFGRELQRLAGRLTKSTPILDGTVDRRPLDPQQVTSHPRRSLCRGGELDHREALLEPIDGRAIVPKEVLVGERMLEIDTANYNTR